MLDALQGRLQPPQRCQRRCDDLVDRRLRHLRPELEAVNGDRIHGDRVAQYAEHLGEALGGRDKLHHARDRTDVVAHRREDVAQYTRLIHQGQVGIAEFLPVFVQQQLVAVSGRAVAGDL